MIVAARRERYLSNFGASPAPLSEAEHQGVARPASASAKYERAAEHFERQASIDRDCARIIRDTKETVNAGAIAMGGLAIGAGPAAGPAIAMGGVALGGLGAALQNQESSLNDKAEASDRQAMSNRAKAAEAKAAEEKEAAAAAQKAESTKAAEAKRLNSLPGGHMRSSRGDYDRGRTSEQRPGLSDRISRTC
jgi:hypothetical protein